MSCNLWWECLRCWQPEKLLDLGLLDFSDIKASKMAVGMVLSSSLSAKKTNFRNSIVNFSFTAPSSSRHDHTGAILRAVQLELHLMLSDSHSYICTTGVCFGGTTFLVFDKLGRCSVD